MENYDLSENYGFPFSEADVSDRSFAHEIYDLRFAWRNSCGVDRSLSSPLVCSAALTRTCACIAPLLVLRHTVLAVQFHICTDTRPVWVLCISVHTCALTPWWYFHRPPTEYTYLFQNANLNLDSSEHRFTKDDQEIGN